MKLEEAIKQSSFTDEYQKVIINLSYTYFSFKEEFSEKLKPFGITIQQFNVLRILRGQVPKGITTSDIRDRMLDKMSDASRMADRLERHGFVEKCRNPEDKRLVVVKITKRGLELLENVKNAELEVLGWAKSINLEEAIELNRILDKMRSES